MLEITSDVGRSMLQSFHERPGFLHQLFLVSGRKAGAYSLLQISVQIFVRIVLRCIRRQKENLYPLPMLFKPFLHSLAMMHPVIVQDQKDLLLDILDQPGHKLDQHRGGHCFPIQHEADFALISDRRDHVDAAS